MEVDVTWLAEVLQADGYTNIEQKEDPGQLPSVSAAHATRLNLTMLLNKQSRLISCVSWIVMRHGLLSKSPTLEAINRANFSSDIWSYALDEDGDLSLEFYIPLFSWIGAIDILTLIHTADEDLRRSANEAGLVEYFK